MKDEKKKKPKPLASLADALDAAKMKALRAKLPPPREQTSQR